MLASPGLPPLAPEVAALTATLGQMQLAVMITDACGKVVWTNRCFDELPDDAGWRPDPENDDAPANQLLRRVLETGESAREHVVTGQAAPSPRTVEQTVTPIPDAGGIGNHALWTFHAAARNSDELGRFENIFSEAQTAAHFGVFRWDARTGTSHWTKETYKLYGLDPAVVRHHWRPGYKPSMKATVRGFSASICKCWMARRASSGSNTGLRMGTAGLQEPDSYTAMKLAVLTT